MKHWKFALVLSALLIIVLSATGCSGSASINVPIKVVNASNIGAISLELVYNPAILEADYVNAAEMARGAESGFNAEIPGRLRILVQNAPNIGGDGTLVNAKFNVITEGGGTALTLENVLARDITTLDYVAVETTPGSYEVVNKTIIGPVISFGQ